VELRGLVFNLDDGKITQYMRNHLTYSYKNLTDIWIEAQTDCWITKAPCRFF